MAVCLAPAVITGCGTATPAEPASNSAAANPATAAPTAAESQVATSSTAVSTTFASKLYGYDLVVPSGWQTLAADGLWLSGSLEGRCPAEWDCFTSPSGEPTLGVGAASVPADMTLAQWQVRSAVGVPDGCIDSAPHVGTPLGGAPTETWTTTCEGEGLHSTKVVAMHAGRGYIFLYASPIGVGVDADRAALSTILTTFRFA